MTVRLHLCSRTGQPIWCRSCYKLPRAQLHSRAEFTIHQACVASLLAGPEAFAVTPEKPWRTFEAGQVVACGQLPDMGVHGDGLMLVQREQAHAGRHLGMLCMLASLLPDWLIL